MLKRPFEILEQGLVYFRSAPVFGFQDVGISPGGPMDRLAVLSGNIMLGRDDYEESLEIIIPPVLKVLEPFCFVITGAVRDVFLDCDGQRTVVHHGEVAYVKAGTYIRMSEARRGFRTYFLWKAVTDSGEKKKLEGRSRGDFSASFTFYDREGKIRILPGPESSAFPDPRDFSSYPWKISSDSNEMGYRLERKRNSYPARGNMVSDAVSDGTIQYTPGGPIILLYHRQTVGGYPRIFQVISADLDKVAQFSPGEYMNFRIISLEESLEINSIRSRDIGLFRSLFF
ncbi:hypothetical protein [Spirochaeta isovalerica]|uniref:Allophanate hydrolase subunit 2 n=1 Tax=Spirochaeta isovalerica TaxID=150 RepID=A0A841RAB7_9SPIO|nr:hypothetical protein [Spirochaeta isovalerica]MBB6480865.1 allophanate hydrolase subunit 2 [Spirochaeta isovalerica]